MKLKWNSKYFRWGMTAFLVIAASICFYYLMFHSSTLFAGINKIISILMPVLLGFVTAYLLTPILNFIENKILFPLVKKFYLKESDKTKSVIRGISIFFTIFLMIAFIYMLLAMLVSQIVPSVKNIVGNFDTYINNFVVWIDRLLVDNEELGNYLINTVNRYSEELELWLNNKVMLASSEVIKTVSLSVISVLGVLWDFVIGIVISVYLLASKEKFAGQAKKIVYALFEKENANRFINNFRFTHRTFIGFISGKVLDSIIIGLLCFIGTTILQTPYAVLVSVIVGVTNVIPFFGPYLGAIPSTILIFIVDPLHPLNCVYFVIFILILQQIDGNIIGPKILGNSTGLASFWVIFAITIFGGFFGILGMIVGVPIFAIIYAAIKAWVLNSLENKQLPLETEAYINVGKVDESGLHVYSAEQMKNVRNLQLNTERINSRYKAANVAQNAAKASENKEKEMIHEKDNKANTTSHEEGTEEE